MRSKGKGIDWYKLERGEIEPPIKLEFDSDTDTRYFLEKYTNFPLEKLPLLSSLEQRSEVSDYTFIGTEFSEYDQLKSAVKEQEQK